jgi:gliding motility-associated protein GldM
MAGSKETPRQRMIGMMYLVLTALLALQVSSAVIDKFQALNNSLEKSSALRQLENNRKLAGLLETISDRGNKPEEVKNGELARKTHAKSEEVISYINKLKKELIKASGGYDEDGNLKGAKEETEVEVFMIGPDKNGKAYELQKKLDEYILFINKEADMTLSKIAVKASEDPFFAKNDDQKNKDFAELNFGQTPLVAALAVLSEYETRVAGIQSLILDKVKLGGDDFPVDELYPMVSTNTMYVPAGTKYEAKLMVAASSSHIRPEMEANGRPVTVDGKGIGSISFMADGGNYGPDGTLKKTWTGKIKMRRANGTDTVYTIKEEYVVTKPVMQIQTAAPPVLYRNCKNSLNVNVPALGASYNPSFTATDAEVTRGNERTIVNVIPKGNKSELKVSSNGLFIGKQEYKVISVPRPEIDIMVNNKRNVLKSGISKTDFRSIIVKAIPDKIFKEQMPEDSEFKVAEWKAYLKRGKTSKDSFNATREVESLVNFNNHSPQEGDVLMIEILKVKRKNYKGEWENVEINNGIFNIQVI